MDIGEWEMSQLGRRREDVIQTHQSRRVVSSLNESLGKGAETCMVSILDRFEHCKLKILGCQIFQLGRHGNGLASSVSCSSHCASVQPAHESQ
jgi:hypothetical protein